MLILQSLPIIAICQVTDYNLRNINLPLGDSIIKAQVSSHYPRKKLLPGSHYYWYGSGKINMNQGSYSGKLLHGKYEVFDKSNRLIRQGNFDYGLKQGTWTAWYPNGLKKEVSDYKDGLLTGDRLFYNNEGEIFSKQRFNNGVLDGKSFFYFKDTTIVKVFKDGKEVIMPAKVNKSKDQVEIPKRRPVFNRVFKPESTRDSIPSGTRENKEQRIIKKKKQTREGAIDTRNDKAIE